ncbi:group II intron reverse transcriptase/maturase [Streptomyces sp. LN704]|uniref:group II intron reverse transcriptase/maturase n=1 Tax=unclassified Streptomyces TaxID=2593676 RepID=UPI00371DEBB3
MNQRKRYGLSGEDVDLRWQAFLRRFDLEHGRRRESATGDPGVSPDRTSTGVQIPKPGRPGEFRPLSIPTVADRVVMTAAKLVMEPVFEAQFTEASYGFRPKRSAIDACEAVRVAANQRREWVLEADIRDCFGTIDHEALMAQVARRVVDRPMLKLIRAWLRMGVLEGGVTSPTGAGTPQGSPFPPLLANIALHVLDEAWQNEGRRLGTLVRYCDDFVVLSPTEQRAEQARELAARVLEQLGMRLHPEKTGIVRLTRGGQGFDFLGFHHRKMESWKWRGRYYLQRWPSARAMRVLRDKVRAATARSKTERPVSAVVADLNPVLRGWAAYFRNGNSGRKFNVVDGYVHERLAIFASAKHRLAGRNWTTRFTYEWITRLGVYRLTGNVHRATAHASR